MAEKNLIIVAGSLRSGSTLLRLMMDAHPQIFCPGEFDFFFDCISDDQNWPDKYEYNFWLKNNRIFQSKLLLIDNELEYPDLILDFVKQLRSEKEFLSLNIHRNFHHIPKLFPSAKYIHLIRDPRDVARSSIGMGWAGSTYYGVDHWISTEKSWNKLLPSLDQNQYTEVNYEDLVGDTVVTLNSICTFIGIEYSDHMLNYPSHSTYSAPDKNLLNQWQRKLKKREIQLLEAKLGRWLAMRNYKSSGFDPINPNYIEQGLIYCQNKMFRAQFAIRRYGVSLYLLEKITRYVDLFSLREKCLQKINNIETRYLK